MQDTNFVHPFRSIFLIVALILLGLLGGLGWFVLRFFKKKKPTGAEEKVEGDEEGLVDNEEKAEEVEKEPEEEEKAGKIHFKCEYNFNAQELSVTVSSLPLKFYLGFYQPRSG